MWTAVCVVHTALWIHSGLYSVFVGDIRTATHMFNTVNCFYLKIVKSKFLTHVRFSARKLCLTGSPLEVENCCSSRLVQAWRNSSGNHIGVKMLVEWRSTIGKGWGWRISTMFSFNKGNYCLCSRKVVQVVGLMFIRPTFTPRVVFGPPRLSRSGFRTFFFHPWRAIPHGSVPQDASLGFTSREPKFSFGVQFYMVSVPVEASHGFHLAWTENFESAERMFSGSLFRIALWQYR